MKSEIQRVRPALAKGDNVPSPTARMVKIQNNRMWAYGGALCLSVPFESSLDCGFTPEPVMHFYAIPREKEVFTMDGTWLKISAGKRELKVPCLESSQIPILDVLGTPQPVDFHMENIKRALDFVPGNEQNATFMGVTFKDGSVLAGNGQMMFYGESGVEGTFQLPVEAVEALVRVDSPVTGMLSDHSAVAFDFEDGTRLTARIIPEGFPDVSRLFQGDRTTFVVNTEAVEEIRQTPCDGWMFSDGNGSYVADQATGTIGEAVNIDDSFRVSHKLLTSLLNLSSTLELMSNRVGVMGENFVAMGALLRNL